MTRVDKAKLDKLCRERGMTIKAALGQLLDWFVTLDRTEQAIALGQVEARDVGSLADLIGRRRPKKPWLLQDAGRAEHVGVEAEPDCQYTGAIRPAPLTTVVMSGASKFGGGRKAAWLR